ncbi:MAG: tetratricopeptide repeat protein [Cyclobacteriaceae bacterium]|nr:tetratricopeptide repeat protein [Cyclobacteriaceae bacterium]
MTRAPLLIALTLLVLVSVPSTAQRDKRKRTATEGQPNEMRLREAEFFFTEGEKFFMLEDYTKALIFFQRVVELNPDNPTVHYKIAEILSKSTKEDDLERAGLSIENALRLEKKNKYFYLLASNIFSSLNNFQKAAQSLETMMKEIKGTEEYLFELAAIYQYDKKPEDAIKVYNRAEAMMGINEVSSLQKQKIFLELGKTDEAIAEGEKLLAAFPDEERYVMGFAETLAQKGQQKKAIEAIERYVGTHPQAGPIKILLAGLYRESGQEKKAQGLLVAAFADPSIDVSSKVIVLSTYTTQISQSRARKFSDPDLESFALKLFDNLKKNYPDEPNVHIVGGDLYLNLKRNREAEKEYLNAIQRGSASFEAWQNLLTLEAESNKFDSLIFHSEQGLEIFPNQAILYYFNGYGHIRKGHYREAASSLEQAKKLSSGNPAMLNEVNGMLGDAYNGTKEYAKSDKAYDEALAFNPNNDYVLNNYSYYLALRKENLEKAERMAATAIKNQPENSSFLDTYAWVLYHRGKYRDARKVMEKALALPDASYTHYEHYGDILFQLGDVDGAVKQWEKARSLTSQHDQIDKKIANRRVY